MLRKSKIIVIIKPNNKLNQKGIFFLYYYIIQKKLLELFKILVLLFSVNKSESVELAKFIFLIASINYWHKYCINITIVLFKLFMYSNYNILNYISI